jgi:hypothetical protein
MQDFALFAYVTTGFLFFLTLILEKLSEWERLSKERRRRLEDSKFASAILFFFSIPVSVTALILTHTEQIYAAVSSYWSFPPLVVAGIGLFCFRCRAPFWYGVIEVMASWVMIWIAIVTPTGPAPSIMSQTSSFGIPLLAKSITLLAGVYVSVRGLDNIDKDPPIRFGRLWGKVFRKKTRTATTGG